MTPFVDRHLGPDVADVETMLEVVGFDSLDELVDAAVPPAIRSSEPLDLPAPLSETEALEALRDVAAENERFTSLIGMGYVATVLPPVIQRNVLENPAWYTAYTPYQPEISQGRLEALLNFQTMVADLTGMELANASLLDEGTAAAEGMTMCRRVGRAPSDRFFVDSAAHPQTIDVIRTRAEPLGIELVLGDPAVDLPDADLFGAFIQNPTSEGLVRDLGPIIEVVHAAGGLVVVAADLLAQALLVSPGEQGADIVVGSAQRFGVPMAFGGPHAAFIATRETFARSLPGRLVGVSVDVAGRSALRLALQTREQHIRREKATSNICTAQVLLAVIASFYAVYHGPDGLVRIARKVNKLTVDLADRLQAAGLTLAHQSFFDTVKVAVPGRADEVIERARAVRINLRRIDGDHVGITLDERSTPELVAEVTAVFEASIGHFEPEGRPPGSSGETHPGLPEVGLPSELARSSEFMAHPVFHQHRSETAMLRYIRQLGDQDLALDRTMIPLGSCTMKLNATAEMMPITWPDFTDIHPFVPLDQAKGYLRVIADMEAWLAEISGYDAVSMQPNAGSQGEYAGLLAIRAYHRHRGDTGRTICLIPASAHGTNAASAVLAGLEVEVVACDDDGNIDVADLRERAAVAGNRLGALMVTYPSTHGVYEHTIAEVCEIVHAHGGQVYLDGANLNALVGLAQPGRFGADVSHFNLHKTFCIPHGGGGPGVGPIGVKAHLAPFLPGHGVVPDAGPPLDGGVGPVASAPWGSAGILPISWMYIRMMGAEGLTRATQIAILSANYVARRLADRFPVLYAGEQGLVAHECIIDTRVARDRAGVTVDDIAKRLIDYGFHAPTMSFPVAGTLMIEPTESEDLGELERFCAAMIAIADEIDDVANGLLAAADSPLANAPHTAEDLLTGDWSRGYSREVGGLPVGVDARTKYWPPVSRIDQAFGDRNIVCSCPPIEAYQR